MSSTEDPRLDLDASEYDRLARSACFVCAIVEGRALIPDPAVIYDDGRVIAFLDQFPPQDGYTLVCPKRHVERWELDLTSAEWVHLLGVAQHVARAVAETTGAIRVYLALLGSPERNSHVHLHICPCPAGTPIERQQLAAMQHPEGRHSIAPIERLQGLGARIVARLTSDHK
jgi:histidine triad (HIT) family protein